jgi:hypothetical protein
MNSNHRIGDDDDAQAGGRSAMAPPPENKCGAEIARYRRAHGQVTVILLAKLAPMPILASEVTSA